MTVLERLTGTADLLRQARSTSKREQERTFKGAKNNWKIHLALYGLEEQRREELLDKLEERTRTQRDTSKNDDALHLSAYTDDKTLAESALVGINAFSGLLRDVELDAQEILQSSAHLTVTPAKEKIINNDKKQQPSKLRQKIGQRLEKKASGLFSAANELHDMAARQKTGDQDYLLFGQITGIEDRKLVIDKMRELGATDVPSDQQSPPTPDKEAVFNLQIETIRVGSPVGAFYLAVNNLLPLLEEINVDGSLLLSIANS